MTAISLRTKAVIIMSALMIVHILSMSFFTFDYFEQRFKRTISDQQFTLISAMAKEIDNKLLTAHQALIVEAQHVPLDIAHDPDKAQRFLDAMPGLHSIFDNKIFIFSATGKLVAESPYEANRRRLDFSFRDYIKKTLAMKKPVIGDPYISSQPHRHPSIMCTAPILNSKGEIVAILAGGLDLMQDNFLGELSRTRIGHTGYLYLFDTNRTIIMHPDRTRIMRQDVSPGSNLLFDRAIDGFEGVAETTTSRGVPVLAAFKSIKITNWILSGDHPTVEAYAPIAQAKEYFFVATVFGLAVVFVLVWFIVGYLTTPLLIFTRHVKEIGSKKGQDRFSRVETRDEIGDLSDAFNKMVGELDQKNASLMQSEELYRTVADFASDMAYWRSPGGRLLYISPNCERITGYLDSEYYETPELLDMIVHPEDRHLWLGFGSFNEGSGPSRPVEFRIITKNGEIRWISHVRRYVGSETGEFMGIRGSHSDITERKATEEKLTFLSLHDILTGIYNRTYFENEMRRLAKQTQPVGIIVCDVDGLKLINDTLGHDSGDKLLVAASQAIREAVPGDAIFARIGGDEFVILIRNATPAAVNDICDGIRAAVRRHNESNPLLLLSISIGTAVGGPVAGTLLHLFKEADDDMYRDKNQRSQSVHRAIVQVFKKALEERDCCYTAEQIERLQVLLNRRQ